MAKCLFTVITRRIDELGDTLEKFSSLYLLSTGIFGKHHCDRGFILFFMVVRALHKDHLDKTGTHKLPLLMRSFSVAGESLLMLANMGKNRY